MTDVFLCYSRRDIEFVRKLATALADRELSVWVDWEGIAPTAAWLSEIQRAIEGADHFVVVISPDSVASEICGLELIHAVKHHKRLVPVRFRSVEQDSLPATLRETQWLEIFEDEPFDSAMERLVTAIRTDPKAVRQHTRLLTGSIEWQSRKRERSLLPLWDVEAVRAVGAVFPAPAAIDAVTFSADGKQLLTGDREGRVIVWDIAVENWLKRACRAAGRELTPDEWRRYLPNRAPHPTCTDIAPERRDEP